jgi:hypothetical protein
MDTTKRQENASIAEISVRATLIAFVAILLVFSIWLGKEIELNRIEIINDDPRSEGRMAHIVHSDILNQPNPAAVREQFLLFYDNCGMDDPTFWDDKNPITSMIVPKKAMGKLKMRIAARLMHSTILCQPDPAKSRTHFLLLLDSYWADCKVETE